MYFGMFPSPLKSLIDRCQMIWSRKFIFKQNTKKENMVYLYLMGVAHGITCLFIWRL